MNIAVILSAGSGSRFGSDVPKQFINLAGKNVIEYTIKAFEENNNIDEICIVADSLYHEKLRKVCDENKFEKVLKIIAGGRERKDSSYEAIKAYESQEDINLIFHDAVRPFVSQEIIDNTVEALKTYDAIDVAIPTADTIIKIDPKKEIIDSIPQRSLLQRGQTPQAFKLEIIKKAHQLANEDENEPFFTDDCGLVKQYLENEVYVVKGEEKNIKITYPEDLLFAEKLIQLNSFTSKGETDFSKLKDKVIVVFGGNSGIGKDIVDISNENGAKAVAFSRENNIDIRVKQDVVNTLSEVAKEFGKIDIVINSAATLTKKQLVHLSDEEIEDEININYLGSVNIAKYSYEYLKDTKGSLIFFTSSSYTRGRAGYSLYSSTKAAIVNFTQALSEEWLEDNIKVNAINPARTDTPMRTKYFEGEDKSLLLDSSVVAKATIETILQGFSGLVIDIKKGIYA